MRSATPTLLVVGANEFSPDRPAPDLKNPLVQPDVVRQIYNVPTFPTVGYASPAATRWFSNNLPAGFEPVESLRARTVSVGGLSVAVILFPQVPDTVPAALLTSIIQTAQQASADLVVGVSPWGFQREALALPALTGAVDVLLGAGEGAPFPVEQTAFAPGILWSRADRDGRCVVEFLFMALPDRQKPRPLLRDVDFAVKEYPLSMSVPSDPRVLELLPQ